MSTGKEIATKHGQLLIPRDVAKALDAVREAVKEKRTSDVRLVQSIAQLYVVCQEEKIELTGVMICQQTGASPGYVSQIWRASEIAYKKKRDLLEEVKKLGFRPFVEKYLPPPSHSRVRQPGRVSDALHNMEDVIESELERMTPDRKRKLLSELSALIDKIKSAPAEKKRA